MAATSVLTRAGWNNLLTQINNLAKNPPAGCTALAALPLAQCAAQMERGRHYGGPEQAQRDLLHQCLQRADGHLEAGDHRRA